MILKHLYVYPITTPTHLVFLGRLDHFSRYHLQRSTFPYTFEDYWMLRECPHRYRELKHHERLYLTAFCWGFQAGTLNMWLSDPYMENGGRVCAIYGQQINRQVRKPMRGLWIGDLSNRQAALFKYRLDEDTLSHMESINPTDDSLPLPLASAHQGFISLTASYQIGTGIDPTQS